MKQINEIKRIQKLAGVITENENKKDYTVSPETGQVTTINDSIKIIEDVMNHMIDNPTENIVSKIPDLAKYVKNQLRTIRKIVNQLN